MVDSLFRGIQNAYGISFFLQSRHFQRVGERVFAVGIVISGVGPILHSSGSGSTRQ